MGKFCVFLLIQVSLSQISSQTYRAKPNDSHILLAQLQRKYCPDKRNSTMQNLHIRKKFHIRRELIINNNKSQCNSVIFSDGVFDKNITYNSYVNGSHDYRRVVFHGDLNYRYAILSSGIIIYNSNVKGNVDLYDSIIHGGLDFRDTIFEGEIDFSRSEIHNRIYLMNVEFMKGLDLRYTNFKEINSIVIGGLKVPVGKLYIDWNILKTTNHYFSKHAKFKTYINFPPVVNFTKVERIHVEKEFFKFLVKNYEIQGKHSSAMAVKYEAAWREDFLSENPWLTFYGWICGYGYKPLRFVLAVVVPFILLFSLTLWSIYYPLVSKVFKKTVFVKKMRLGYKIDSIGFNNTTKVILPIVYSLLLSFSIIVSIRFKEKWLVQDKIYLNVNHKIPFIVVIIFGYISGLMFKFVVIILLKVSYSTQIKYLLEF